MRHRPGDRRRRGTVRCLRRRAGVFHGRRGCLAAPRVRTVIASHLRGSAVVLPAGLAGAFPPGRPGRRVGHERARIEAEVRRLCAPVLAERGAVHVALGGAGEQRCALGHALVLCRSVQPAPGQRGLDLGPARGEGLDDLAGDARDLEAPVGMGLPDAVSELRERRREFVAVEGAEQHLGGVELLVGHGPPLAVGALHHVGDHRMGVERRIEVARGVVPEGGDDRLLAAGADHASGLRILPRTRSGVLHPGFRDMAFDPVEGAPDGAVVGLDDAPVAADQGGQGDRLRRAEGEVAAGPMVERAVLSHPAQPPAGAVRDAAFENRPERLGIDRTFEAEACGALSGPGAGGPVPGIVPGIVAVALVVARPLGGRGDGADRGDHVRSRPRRTGAGPALCLRTGPPVPRFRPSRRSAAPACPHRARRPPEPSLSG